MPGPASRRRTPHDAGVIVEQHDRGDHLPDPETGRYRPATARDIHDAARLVDMLDNIHLFSRSLKAGIIAEHAGRQGVVYGEVHGYERLRWFARHGVTLEEIRAATILNGPAYDPTNGRIRS